MTDIKDFGTTGLDIQTAMIRHVTANPNKETRPDYLLWNGLEVRTSYSVWVPMNGRFRLRFLSPPRKPPHGVDVKIENGFIVLADGKHLQTLRTWYDERYEAMVEYPYQSKDGLLKIWNVYQRSWPNGRTTEEKWTGNAGFWIEEEDGSNIVFHCSPGPVDAPDFEELVFRLSIDPKSR